MKTSIISRLKIIMAGETFLKNVLSALFIMLAIIFAEIFIFNFRHWQSVNNEPLSAEYSVSDCLSREDANAFRYTGGAAYLEVTNLDLDIENIAMDFIFPEKGVTAVEQVDYHLEVIDEGNSNMYKLPGMEFMHLVPQSHYDYLNLYGKAKAVRLCFDNLYEGDLIRIEYLFFNSIVPLMISKKRILALFAIIYLLFLLRQGGILYRIPVGERSRLKNISLVILLLIEIGFTYWGINLNHVFEDPQSNSERQFMLMAEALLQGETHLLIEPPHGLKDLEDPYDYHARIQACAGQEEPLWDTAYYDGHYYVYFGVAPIILFYLPYYLITGSHIKTTIVVFINAVFVLIGVALLLNEIITRWFRCISLSVYLMFTAMFSFGAGLIFLIMKPDFYAVPLSMAMACCFLGLYFWLHSIKEDRIDILCITLGSLLMALEAAIRPQFLLASFLCILLLWNAIFKKRILFSRKSIGATLGFVMPYVIIAILVMLYNYARFGSAFDFGANYNLTFNNMPYRGWHIDRLLNGTVGFLFTPSTVMNRFPYFDISTFVTSYQGPTADENLFGGLIYNSIYLLPTLFPVLFIKYFEDIRFKIYLLIAPICSLAVMFIDANMAGVLTRYNCDFAWYLMISSFLILCACLQYAGINGYENTIKKAIYIAFYVCFVFFLLRNFLCLFAGDGYPKRNTRLIWHTVEHLVEFWH